MQANASTRLLLLLSIASFVPQYRRILSRGPDCLGISPYYVVLNLIVATEQLALGLYMMLEHVSAPAAEAGAALDSQPSLAEWLNLCQLVVVFCCHFVL
jgi:hypothetical protein